MAFRIIRLRKEARRNAKLEEIFQERDKTQSGFISEDQLRDIYRIYQVDLDEEKAAKIIDENKLIKREDFFQFAKDNHLLDFQSVLGDAMSPKRSKKKPGTPTKPHNKSDTAEETKETKSGWPFLTRFFSPRVSSPVREDVIDKVESAFKKFDLDGDGFLSWDEFQQMSKDVDQEQALRIFQSCNQAGDGLISLDEFRSMVNRKPSTPAAVALDPTAVALEPVLSGDLEPVLSGEIEPVLPKPPHAELDEQLVIETEIQESVLT